MSQATKQNKRYAEEWKEGISTGTTQFKGNMESALTLRRRMGHKKASSSVDIIERRAPTF